MYSCPLCGETSNRKGQPFDSVQRVVGHINGSRDGLHEEEHGKEYQDEIEAATRPSLDESTSIYDPLCEYRV